MLLEIAPGPSFEVHGGHQRAPKVKGGQFYSSTRSGGDLCNYP
jgi:hypothetical protein